MGISQCGSQAILQSDIPEQLTTIVDYNRQRWESCQHGCSFGCLCFKEKPQLQSGGECQDNRLPPVAYMGKLKPPIFVVPIPIVAALALELEILSIEVENFQEDLDGELSNRHHITSRGHVTITTAGQSSLSGRKIGYKHMSSCWKYCCGRNSSVTITSSELNFMQRHWPDKVNGWDRLSLGLEFTDGVAQNFHSRQPIPTIIWGQPQERLYCLESLCCGSLHVYDYRLNSSWDPMSFTHISWNWLAVTQPPLISFTLFLEACMHDLIPLDCTGNFSCHTSSGKSKKLWHHLRWYLRSP